MNLRIEDSSFEVLADDSCVRVEDLRGFLIRISYEDLPRLISALQTVQDVREAEELI